jgi:hypothetical protein
MIFVSAIEKAAGAERLERELIYFGIDPARS